MARRRRERSRERPENPKPENDLQVRKAKEEGQVFQVSWTVNHASITGKEHAQGAKIATIDILLHVSSSRKDIENKVQRVHFITQKAPFPMRSKMSKRKHLEMNLILLQ